MSVALLSERHYNSVYANLRQSTVYNVSYLEFRGLKGDMALEYLVKAWYELNAKSYTRAYGEECPDLEGVNESESVNLPTIESLVKALQCIEYQIEIPWHEMEPFERESMYLLKDIQVEHLKKLMDNERYRIANWMID